MSEEEIEKNRKETVELINKNIDIIKKYCLENMYVPVMAVGICTCPANCGRASVYQNKKYEETSQALVEHHINETRRLKAQQN